MKIFRNTLTALALLGILALPMPGSANSWDIDPAHSEIGFKIRHMMVTNVRGNFRDVKGTLEFDETDVSRSTIEVTITAASIDTGIEKRDDHLRSPDFFDVETYPAITFRSTKFTRLAEGVFQVTGDLTMHGVTREVILDVEGLVHQARDPWGNTVMGASATTTLNRKDYGLTWNKALETGGVLVGEEVTVLLEVELRKRAE